jgi:hypothetical protein
MELELLISEIFVKRITYYLEVIESQESAYLIIGVLFVEIALHLNCILIEISVVNKKSEKIVLMSQAFPVVIDAKTRIMRTDGRPLFTIPIFKPQPEISNFHSAPL